MAITACGLCFIYFFFFYPLFAPLQIIQEAALTQYLDALQQWEDEKERQQNQFIITDKKLSERQAILIDKVVSHIQSQSFKNISQRI